MYMSLFERIALWIIGIGALVGIVIGIVVSQGEARPHNFSDEMKQYCIGMVSVVEKERLQIIADYCGMNIEVDIETQ